MSMLHVNGMEHYYEQTGDGPALVFVHGAFADARIWEPQWTHFAARYRLLRYDLRGHGRTGVSSLASYSMGTFADDLAALLAALEIDRPAVCGLSWGGSIAQAYAVRYPESLRRLVLAGTSVAIDLTLVDKLLCRLLFPRWAMLETIRLMSVERFTRFSLWLARLTRGRRWLGQDETAMDYLEQCMLRMEQGEYLKIWEAIYGFHLLPLERITCPTLVLNGEHEPKGTLRHTEEILRRVPHAEARVVPRAFHGSNMDNPQAFNRTMEQFLDRTA
ncbi:MAG: alpha/beta hydrolase [Chloroflexota bacterium]